MNNKILSIKRTSAIFLVTVLLAGIIALSSPSSFMVGAQAVPQYGMEREYGSYEQQTEYPSYQSDYKPSYGKDNYKSKDSVSIKKLNCINSNFNTNGDINGDINIFSPSRTATDSDEGDLGAGNNGEEDWGYGNDGYQQNKKDKDFACIINNNNNINGGEEPEPLTCEECFTELSAPELQRVLDLLSVTTIEGACTALGTITQEFFEAVLSESIAGGTPTPEQILRINEIIECLLEEAGIEFAPESDPWEVNGFNTQSGSLNAQGGGGSLVSFDVHDGGTGDLTVLEKLSKSKTRWLELLQ